MSSETMVDVTFQREACSTLWDEILPLLQRHWAEITHYPDIALDVDRATYEKVEAMGFLRCYTVRLADGTLIGYNAFMVKANLHYQQSKQAQEDVLYLHPDYRRSRIGVQLIAYADEQLRAEGVQVVYHHQKLAHPALGAVVRRMGYEAVETIWAKRLDR